MNIDEMALCGLGDHVQRWDFIMEISHLDLLPDVLRPLRGRSDDLADDVVNFLQLKPGQDGLAAIQDHLATVSEPNASVVAFWAAVNTEPPVGVTAFVGPVDKGQVRCKEECTPMQAMRVNNRVAAPSLSEGQAVFWRYSAQIFTALMHFSLAVRLSVHRPSRLSTNANLLIPGWIFVSQPGCCHGRDCLVSYRAPYMKHGEHWPTDSLSHAKFKSHFWKPRGHLSPSTRDNSLRP